MPVIGTFGSFTAARLGIYNSQAAMNVTGNNVANINTPGYTRQRPEIRSLYGGGVDKFYSNLSLNIGYGALIENVTQARDPYLDIRFRNEQSHLGETEALLKGYKEIASVLDEVGKGDDEFGMIEHQLNEIIALLQNLSLESGSQDADTVLRASASSLATLMNSYANKLDQVMTDTQDELKSEVDSVNTTLVKIRELNDTIRKASLCGDNALELRDERNVLIDELSKKMAIDVTYSEERIDQYSSVEKLTITMKGTNIKLVDGIYGAKVTMLPFKENIESMPYMGPNNVATSDADKAIRLQDGTLAKNPAYDPDAKRFTLSDGTQTDDEMEAWADNRYLLQVEALRDAKGRYQRKEGKEVTESSPLGDNDLVGGLQALRELLTEEGEFASIDDLNVDPAAATKRGIPYYQRSMDALAQKLAEVFNRANTMDPSIVFEMDGGDFVDKDGNPIVVNVTGADGNPLTADDLKKEENFALLQDFLINNGGVLKKEYANYNGGPLFSSRGDQNNPNGITASNITISKGWQEGSIRVLNTTKGGELRQDGNWYYPTTATDNIDHIITELKKDQSYVTKDVVGDAVESTYFKGSFREFFTQMSHALAADMKETQVIYENHNITSLDLDDSRASVSSVDLNEEATNMMQFQRSYQAACQLLTTLDSMLDKLINGTI
ncbi:MAG: hypothetical protein HFE73_00720 [Firmicutes bacterium]|nr:hypothetical protein [Bacillota bacterium]